MLDLTTLKIDENGSVPLALANAIPIGCTTAEDGVLSFYLVRG
jgi:hypothetical protein